MTTTWEVPNDLWVGKTVSVLCGAECMNNEMMVLSKDTITIVINDSSELDPLVTAFIALDNIHPFWVNSDKFDGIKICGVQCDIDAFYTGLLYEEVKIGVGHTVHVRSNVLAAMRLAYRAGAAKISLIGFSVKTHGCIGVVEGVNQLTTEIQAAGVIVEQIDVPSKNITQSNKAKK